MTGILYVHASQLKAIWKLESEVSCHAKLAEACTCKPVESYIETKLIPSIRFLYIQYQHLIYFNKDCVKMGLKLLLNILKRGKK